MKNLVIVSFPAKENMLDALKSAMTKHYLIQEVMMDVFLLILTSKILLIQFT